MLPNAFVCGINGVGKTMILRRVAELRPDLTIIPGSASLMEFLGIHGDYDALRAVPEPEALNALTQMIAGLMDRHSDGGMIFDAHLLNIVRGRVKDVTPPIIHGFDVLTLIIADSAKAYARMQADGRDRALFPPVLSPHGQLLMLGEYDQKYRKKFSQVLSDHIPVSRKPFFTNVLLNHGSLEEAARSFIHHFDYAASPAASAP